MSLDKELFKALGRGDVKEVRKLLEKGANVNAKDIYGWTPLHAAASSGHVDVVTLLIEKGADVNAKEIFYGWTPLHWAIINGYVDVARLLIEKGADPNLRNRDGKTPIDLAREKGYMDIVRLLESALLPIKLLGFEQDGIEAGKWGKLIIKLRAKRPVKVDVKLSGDIDWLDLGTRELLGESFIEIPVKPRIAGKIPVKAVIKSEGKSISEMVWLKPLPEYLEWIENRIKEVKEFVRRIEEEG
jgi:hypothetical protein